jgi:hypothetical protein
MLMDDFQIQQAYNYLKAWHLIDDQKAAASAAPEPVSKNQ